MTQNFTNSIKYFWQKSVSLKNFSLNSKKNRDFICWLQLKLMLKTLLASQKVRTFPASNSTFTYYLIELKAFLIFHLSPFYTSSESLKIRFEQSKSTWCDIPIFTLQSPPPPFEVVQYSYQTLKVQHGGLGVYQCAKNVCKIRPSSFSPVLSQMFHQVKK